MSKSPIDRAIERAFAGVQPSISSPAHEPPTTGTKHCPDCNRDLPVLHFAACGKSPDHLDACCRECRSERNRPYTAKRRRESKHRQWKYLGDEFRGER